MLFPPVRSNQGWYPARLAPRVAGRCLLSFSAKPLGFPTVCSVSKLLGGYGPVLWGGATRIPGSSHVKGPGLTLQGCSPGG